MKLSLRYLILSVALLSVLLTLFSSITAGYRVNQQALIDSTLETNRVYAQKLAVTTDNFLNMTLQKLSYSADEITNYLEESNAESLILQEANRLKEDTNTFNSVVVVAEDGTIIAASPQSLNLIGRHLNSPGAKEAIAAKEPLVSKPFMSITNRLIVFISQPIFDKEENYIGYIGGSIYLTEQNILNEILGEHFYQDGSYVFVVDEDGRIIYHPNSERINAFVKENEVVYDVMQGNSGVAQVTNTEEIEMLAGYAYVSTAKWGIVSQRPTEIALLPSKDMKNEMIKKTLPYLLLSFILIFYISYRIAHPLQKLTHYAMSTTEDNKVKKVRNVRAWYYEAIQLENALVNSFVFFQDRVNYFIHQSTTDPLTGLLNRRTMDEHTKKWLETESPFSIILFDIDRFKRINDTYGHGVGDDVLVFLAKEMREVAGEDNVCCRYGGEEFIMLLPNKTKYEAFEVAERLRKKLASTVSPCGEVITISAGIASYPNCAGHTIGLIESADKCLYEAKNSGRNKSIMAEDQL